MPQGAGSHKKSNQGFASSHYDREKKRAAQSRGGSAKVAKGFARMSPERRREVARKGGKAEQKKGRGLGCLWLRSPRRSVHSLTISNPICLFNRVVFGVTA